MFNTRASIVKDSYVANHIKSIENPFMALVASFWVVIYPFEGANVKFLAGDGFCNGGEG